MTKCPHCGQELPKVHPAGQEDEEQRLMALFTLRHKLEGLAQECQGLLQIVDSLMLADNSTPLSSRQRKAGLQKALYGEDHAKKI